MQDPKHLLDHAKSLSMIGGKPPEQRGVMKALKAITNLSIHEVSEFMTFVLPRPLPVLLTL